jgi:4-hydroxy-tetrahydrodipicolinate synthase
VNTREGDDIRVLEIKGIITAMATPFFEDESINEEELRNQVERHIKAGMDGIFCLGTNGENYAMDFEEKVRVIKITVEQAAGRIPVYAGTGCITTKETIRLTQKAQQLGADCASIICPYFAAMDQNGLYEHFSAVAKETDLPILIYNMPARTGINVEYPTAVKLSKIKNIAGIKDSSGNFDNMLRYIEETNDDFAVLSGNDSLILWCLMAGGQGGISGIANIMPRIMESIYTYWKAGDFEKAKKAQDYIRPIRDCLKLGNPNSVVKRAANLAGQNLGPARAPFNINDKKIDAILKKTVAMYDCDI